MGAEAQGAAGTATAAAAARGCSADRAWQLERRRYASGVAGGEDEGAIRGGPFARQRVASVSAIHRSPDDRPLPRARTSPGRACPRSTAAPAPFSSASSCGSAPALRSYAADRGQGRPALLGLLCQWRQVFGVIFCCSDPSTQTHPGVAACGARQLPITSAHPAPHIITCYPRASSAGEHRSTPPPPLGHVPTTLRPAARGAAASRAPTRCR